MRHSILRVHRLPLLLPCTLGGPRANARAHLMRGAIRGHQRPSEAMRQAIRGHQRPSADFLDKHASLLALLHRRLPEPKPCRRDAFLINAIQAISLMRGAISLMRETFGGVYPLCLPRRRSDSNDDPLTEATELGPFGLDVEVIRGNQRQLEAIRRRTEATELGPFGLDVEHARRRVNLSRMRGAPW